LKKIYFDYDVTTDNKFLVFFNDEGEALSYDINTKVYDFIKNKYLKKIEENEVKSFQAIGRQWAIDTIEKNR